MSETDLAKESLLNLVSLNSVVTPKAFEVILLLGLFESKLFPKNPLTLRGFLLCCPSQYIRKLAREGFGGATNSSLIDLKELLSL